MMENSDSDTFDTLVFDALVRKQPQVSAWDWLQKDSKPDSLQDKQQTFTALENTFTTQYKNSFDC